ncbi:MAG TPA: hypothetical protein DCS83_02145 [Prevotella sp.]|nr:hypothetical protein [Prevotella sp.]
MINRSLSLLDSSGDTTITWDEDRDDDIRAVIEKKMAEGVRFFIVKPRFGGLGKSKTQITSVDEIQNNTVSIEDADFIGLMSSSPKGIAAIPSNRDQTEIVVVKAAKTASEVAVSHSVGIKPLVGG